MNKEKVKGKIIETYLKYRANLLDNYANPENFNVVIKISPEKVLDLIKNEAYIERNIEAQCHFIELCGRKTPVIIDDELPKHTEFIIQSQKDYEREETEKQLKKFFKMFGD